MLRAAVYGFGWWGKRLVESVQGKSAKIAFVKGVTRDTAARREFGEKAGIALTTRYEDVLEDPGVDAVVLATPHSQHHDQVVQAAAAGKHVYVEKPITLNAASARSAIRACRNAGVTLGMGFGRRYLPAYLEMMRRIRAGDIGQVLHIEGHNGGSGGYRHHGGSWRGRREESPAGSMTARGIHMLDAMLPIAGLVKTVYAYSERRVVQADVDDTTAMLLRFASGVTGYLGTMFASGEYRRLHVFGSKGWLEMRGETVLAARGLTGEVTLTEFAVNDREQAVLEAFADAAAGGEPFAVSDEQAINGIAVLEAIVASAAGGAPVEIGAIE
jgi:predicted dehydrogenase